jgi:hypothetical protein
MDNTKDCSITTLCCNDRETLFFVIRTFFINTDVSDIRVYWFLLLQGCSPAFVDAVERELAVWCEEPRVEFRVVHLESNLGLTRGINHMHDCVHADHHSAGCDIFLHVEDDWITLPREITGLGPRWLACSLAVMRTMPNVSSVSLRCYATKEEKWQYGFTRNIPYVGHAFATSNFNYATKLRSPGMLVDGCRFRALPTFLFTLNPVLRRHSYYVSCGALPLTDTGGVPAVPGDDVHCPASHSATWTTAAHAQVGGGGGTAWGRSEGLSMECIREGDCLYIGDVGGVMGHHEDWVPCTDETISSPKGRQEMIHQ